MINRLSDAFRSSELGIDLGTGVTRVASRCGMVKVQPSLSGGRPAMRGGVVLDGDAAVEVLKPMLRESRWFGMAGPRTVACTPSNVTLQQREELADCVVRAGARSVAIVPEAVAAAVGAGIDIGSGRTTFMVDLGEGHTDCAVIQRGKVVESQTVGVGCGDLRRRLRQCARQVAHLHLTDSEAERLLRSVGFENSPSGKVGCTGLRHGRVCELGLARTTIQEALRPALRDILGVITDVLSELPANMVIEVIEDGIHLTGGGALLRGMREQVSRVTQIEVQVVRDPLRAVVDGARSMLPFVNELSQTRQSRIGRVAA